MSQKLTMPVRLREEDVALAEPHRALRAGLADAQNAGLPAQLNELEDVRKTEVAEVPAQCHGLCSDLSYRKRSCRRQPSTSATRRAAKRISYSTSPSLASLSAIAVSTAYEPAAKSRTYPPAPST